MLKKYYHLHLLQCYSLFPLKLLLKKTKYKLISLDNYSSGTKKNHIKNSRVKYVSSHTKNISQILKKPKNIKAIFHFGEFARIYQSFLNMNECINSNTIGTNSVFNFCLKNKIKLIYFELLFSIFLNYQRILRKIVTGNQ